MEYPLSQALQSTLAILVKVRPGDLAAPTPCASWDVHALINHFIGSARWWAAMLEGEAARTPRRTTWPATTSPRTRRASGSRGGVHRRGCAGADGPAGAGRVPRCGTAGFWPRRISSCTAGIWLAPSGSPPPARPRAGRGPAHTGQARHHGRLSRAGRPACSGRHARPPPGQRRPTGLPRSSGGQCDRWLIPPRSSGRPSRTGASCSPTATGCSVRSMTPRTWCRRPSCAPGGPTRVRGPLVRADVAVPDRHELLPVRAGQPPPPDAAFGAGRAGTGSRSAARAGRDRRQLAAAGSGRVLTHGLGGDPAAIVAEREGCGSR